MESTKNDVKTLFLQLVRHWVTALIGYCCTPSGLSVARSRGVMVLFRERTTKSAKNTKNLDFSEARSYRVWAPHPRRSWTLHRLIPGKIEINFHRLKSVEIGWNLPVLWTLMVKNRSVEISWLTKNLVCLIHPAFDPICLLIMHRSFWLLESNKRQRLGACRMPTLRRQITRLCFFSLK